METNFSQLMELIFITANQIAYPQNAPPNTPEIKNPRQEKKYPFWDYRKFTDNQGWLKIDIDYNKYKPKKYYVDASQQVVENHLKALQKKQNLLKKFKYHQDFDRIDNLNADQSITFQNQVQKTLFIHLAFSAYLSRVMILNSYHHHFSYTLWKKLFFKAYFLTLPFFLGVNFCYQHSNPINHEFFRSNGKQIRMYEGIAYDLDGYQDVNKIKYSYKYPQREQFYNTVYNITEKKNRLMYQDSIKYFKRVYGIVDPEPFMSKQKKEQDAKNLIQK